MGKATTLLPPRALGWRILFHGKVALRERVHGRALLQGRPVFLPVGSQWPPHLQPRFGNGSSPHCRDGAQMLPDLQGPNTQLRLPRIFLEWQPRCLTFRRMLSACHLPAPSPYSQAAPVLMSAWFLQLKSVSRPGVSDFSVFFPEYTEYVFWVPRTSSFTLFSSSAPCGLKTPPLSAGDPGE